MSSNICYRKLRHYKYQLIDENFLLMIEITPSADIQIENFIELTTEGKLTIMKGYAWDGPSGPTFDTKNFMRGSLVHDALYQLIRENKFDEEEKEKRRRYADDLLREMCKTDSMSSFRAWYVHKAVCWFGKRAIKQKEKYKKKFYAPKSSSLIKDQKIAT